MARKPKPFRIVEKENSISLIFDKAGWDSAHTKMCEDMEKSFMLDGTIKGQLAAEWIKDAFDLKLLSNDGQASFRRYMDMLDIDVQNDEESSPS